MEQLGGIDGAFVYAETPTTHLHVVGLLVLDTSTMEGGYSFDRIRRVVEERLLAVPAMRHKLATVPLHISRPYWVEDPDIDVDRHLHRVQVPAPGDDIALSTLVGEIASRPLPRDRPLWEIWVVEGLSDDRVGVVAKMHHSTIDGVSGANLLGSLFDTDADSGSEADAMRPGAPSGASRLLPTTGSLGEARTRGVEALRGAELFGRGVLSRLAQPLEIARLVPMTTYRIVSTLWSLGRHHDGATTPVAPEEKEA